MLSSRVRATIALIAVVVSITGVHTVEPAAFALRGADQQAVACAPSTPGDTALLLLNRRGLVKRSRVPEGVEPVTWVSGYGSLTVNSLGPDFPFAGINQAGLTVIALPLEAAAYPARGHQAEIDPLQWVQYALDSFENVRQVVFSAERYRIHGPVGYHFLACDADDACAIIEPIDGTLQSRAEEKLPLPILTTRTFADAIDYLNVSLGYAGAIERTGEDEVLESFLVMVDKVNAARSRKTTTPRQDAFRILRETGGGEGGVRVVFEPDARRAWIDVGGEPWPVPLLDFDLGCRAPRRMVVVPPRPTTGAEEAFGAWDAAAVTAVADVAAKTVPAPAGDLATWADRYECSERPPIKHPDDPAAIPVD